MKKTVLLTTVIIGSIAVSFTVLSEQQVKPWNVPEAGKKMKTAVPSSPASIAEGKTLWNTHCKSCHGGKGLGDGSKAAQLKTEPGDFSIASFQDQTDGAIFYKLSEGREDMPSFKKKLPDADDRWNMVNFIRTLKK